MAKKVIIHHKFEEYKLAHNNTYPNPYDIALIQLEYGIDFTQINGYYKVNSICLPQENHRQEKEEMAQVVGWGYINQIENKTVKAERLQMGYMNVMKTTNDSNDNYGLLIELFSTHNNSANMCQVSTMIYLDLDELYVMNCGGKFFNSYNTFNFILNLHMIKFHLNGIQFSFNLWTFNYKTSLTQKIN